jgi:hypothetical protein
MTDITDKEDNIEYVEKAWCGGNKVQYNGIKNNIEALKQKNRKINESQEYSIKWYINRDYSAVCYFTNRILYMANNIGTCH